MQRRQSNGGIHALMIGSRSIGSRLQAKAVLPQNSRSIRDPHQALDPVPVKQGQEPVQRVSRVADGEERELPAAAAGDTHRL